MNKEIRISEGDEVRLSIHSDGEAYLTVIGGNGGGGIIVQKGKQITIRAVAKIQSPSKGGWWGRPLIPR